MGEDDGRICSLVRSSDENREKIALLRSGQNGTVSRQMRWNEVSFGGVVLELQEILQQRGCGKE